MCNVHAAWTEKKKRMHAHSQSLMPSESGRKEQCYQDMFTNAGTDIPSKTI